MTEEQLKAIEKWADTVPFPSVHNLIAALRMERERAEVAEEKLAALKEALEASGVQIAERDFN